MGHEAAVITTEMFMWGESNWIIPWQMVILVKVIKFIQSLFKYLQIKPIYVGYMKVECFSPYAFLYVCIFGLRHILKYETISES